MRLTLGWPRAPRTAGSWCATLALLAIVLMAVGLSPRAEAAIAKHIVDAETGAMLGSITLPAAEGALTGPSPAGVTFQIAAVGLEFTEADLASLSWNLTSTTPFLSLTAAMGDFPCVSPAHGPCSQDTLLLTLQSLSTGHVSCPPPPAEGSSAVCAASGLAFPPIEFIDAAPAYACRGFDSPLAAGPVTVKGPRALPLKARLLDADGFALADDALGAPPVLQVHHQSGVGETPDDVSPQAVGVGQGTDGNAFEFSGSRWRFNLKTRNYTAPGIYTLTMISGDETEYRIDPVCEAQFVVNP